MALTKLLITVTTYPLPSRSYDELVCTAGVTENGDWIRIYPVPLQFLKGLRKDGKVKTFKYTWIEVDLKRRTDDFRPESRSPIDYSFKDIVVHGDIGTENNWAERKKFCTQKGNYSVPLNLLRYYWLPQLVRRRDFDYSS